MTGRVSLDRSAFTDGERVLCEAGGLRAVSFLFSTGVAGLRLETPEGTSSCCHGRDSRSGTPFSTAAA